MNGEQTITVRVQRNYGTDMIYPASDTAMLFARLVGKKTFSKYDLAVIRDLGYEVNVQAQELTI